MPAHHEMPRRAPETLADYLVVAICPALIMLLVGSLMYFLVEVFYQGEYKGRLLWVMAMFVLGIVGIARISMEEGLAYASLFGAALAAAIAMALMQFVKDGLIIGGPIMILVWWAAHKLTWDCTLIDDAQDVSGQGLLQQIGLDTSAGPPDASSPPGTTSRANEPEATTSTAAAPSPPWWETLLEPDRRPHAPGVWVIYFSLAALPLFGIGGWFVSEPVARSRVFGLLVIYVASGMGLLLATSFLGLRRYLRQRKLEMPLEMTSTWIVVGVLMIFATLIVATILPRPSREYSLSQLPFTVTSAVRRASQFAMGKGGTKDDDAKSPATTDAEKDQSTKREGKQPAGEQSEGKPQSGDKGDAEGKGKGKGQGKGEGKSKASGGESKGPKSGESKGDSSKGGNEAKKRDAEAQSGKESKDKAQDDQQQQGDEQKSPDDNSGQSPQPESEAQSPSESSRSPGEMLTKVTSLLGQTVATLLKWIFYGVLAVAALIAAWVYREELAAAWRKLMEELSELWNWWNGRKPATEQPAAAGPVAPPPRPFASYADPFLTGDARGMSWPWLVRYTFEALEAWGREQGCARAIGQTPHEFALVIGALEPPIAANAQTLAAWYGQLAYAPRAASGGSPDVLRQLWSGMIAASSTPASRQYAGSGATTEM